YEWRYQMTTVQHDRRRVRTRVVDQDLGSSVPVNGKELRVDPAAAFPEEDAERINSVLRHNDIEGCVWIVCRISVLAARGIAETEQCAQRISRVRRGNTRPPVVHIQAEEIVSSLEIQVGSEFMHRIVQPEIRGAGTGHAGEIHVAVENAAIRSLAGGCAVVEVEDCG